MYVDISPTFNSWPSFCWLLLQKHFVYRLFVESSCSLPLDLLCAFSYFDVVKNSLWCVLVPVCISFSGMQSLHNVVLHVCMDDKWFWCVTKGVVYVVVQCIMFVHSLLHTIRGTCFSVKICTFLELIFYDCVWVCGYFDRCRFEVDGVQKQWMSYCVWAHNLWLSFCTLFPSSCLPVALLKCSSLTCANPRWHRGVRGGREMQERQLLCFFIVISGWCCYLFFYTRFLTVKAIQL